MDVRKLNYFYYSQNSLNTFNKCPLKFKLKYFDGMSWRNDSDEDVEYYEGMKIGLDFHLICERYFSKIPLGNKNCNKDIDIWTERLLQLMSIEEQNLYLPEYEIKMIKDHVKLQAKYDLIVIKPSNEVEIWDWKTENRKLSQKELENRFQTIVYMYTLGEKISEILDREIKLDKIKMIYWQPQYPEHIITISYSEDKHKKNRDILYELIENINQYDFVRDFNRSLYIKQCKFCEFNCFCNDKNLNLTINI